MSQSYDALLFLAERDSGVMSSGYCTLSGESAPPGWIADCFILVRVCVCVCVHLAPTCERERVIQFDCVLP